MNAIVTNLPEPSKKHATCAWCRQDFDRIVDLLDHVEAGHVDGTNEGHDGRKAA